MQSRIKFNRGLSLLHYLVEFLMSTLVVPSPLPITSSVTCSVFRSFLTLISVREAFLCCLGSNTMAWRAESTYKRSRSLGGRAYSFDMIYLGQRGTSHPNTSSTIIVLRESQSNLRLLQIKILDLRSHT